MAKPLQNLWFPLMLRIHLPIMERGIKGVRLINNLGLEIYHCDVKIDVSRLTLYGWRGLNAVTVILRLFTEGSLKGRSPFNIYLSPSLIKGGG